MERQELEAFLVLSEELHFGRTAERMHTSRARVSQLISTVERRVGAALFERTSRRVALTPLGAKLRADLEPHHKGIREAVDSARAAASGVTGVLRVGFMGWAAEIVIEIAEALQERHPGCRVTFREVQINDLYGPLRAGEVDVQLIPVIIPQPDLVIGPVLIRDDVTVAVPADHPFAARESVTLAELSGQTLLSMEGPTLEYYLDHHGPPLGPNGRPNRRVAHSDSSWMLLLAKVATGEGLLFSGAQGAWYNAYRGVVYVPVRDGVPVDHYLTWRRADAGSPLIDAFVQTALALIPQPRKARPDDDAGDGSPPGDDPSKGG